MNEKRSRERIDDFTPSFAACEFSNSAREFTGSCATKNHPAKPLHRVYAAKSGSYLPRAFEINVFELVYGIRISVVHACLFIT